MVVEAGGVEEGGLDGRIKRAEILAFLRLGAATIGVGALKTPNPSYMRKVFENAHTEHEAATFRLDLGRVTVAAMPSLRPTARASARRVFPRSSGSAIAISALLHASIELSICSAK